MEDSAIEDEGWPIESSQQQTQAIQQSPLDTLVIPSVNYGFPSTFNPALAAGRSSSAVPRSGFISTLGQAICKHWTRWLLRVLLCGSRTFHMQEIVLLFLSVGSHLLVRYWSLKLLSNKILSFQASLRLLDQSLFQAIPQSNHRFPLTYFSVENQFSSSLTTVHHTIGRHREELEDLAALVDPQFKRRWHSVQCIDSQVHSNHSRFVGLNFFGSPQRQTVAACDSDAAQRPPCKVILARHH